MSDRAELVAQARTLRSEGLLLREIAERMGCAIQTVSQYLNDPDLSKLRARKDSYRGTCSECGEPTDGSNGRDAAPDLCMECRQWTVGGVLLAFEQWADDHGGVSPRCEDAVRSDRRLPTERSVSKLFGSWNAGLLAAGFELRCDRRPETWEQMLADVRAGVRTADIARRFGVCETAIHERFRRRGMRVRDERPAGYYEAIARENGRRLAEYRWGVAA